MGGFTLSWSVNEGVNRRVRIICEGTTYAKGRQMIKSFLFGKQASANK